MAHNWPTACSGRTATSPVLITTGETSSDALLQANAHHYALLQKPIASEDLRRAIAMAVTQPAGAIEAAVTTAATEN